MRVALIPMDAPSEPAQDIRIRISTAQIRAILITLKSCLGQMFDVTAHPVFRKGTIASGTVIVVPVQ